MAFENANTVAEGASWADFQNRNNPLAGDANVVKVYGLTRGCCCGDALDITLLYAVNNAGGDIDFTQTVAITGLRYYKIRVTDNCGNEAVGLIDVTATTTLINVDTSALDASKTWQVQFFLASAVAGVDCNCETCGSFDINDVTGNPTDTITTVPAQGTLVSEVSATGLAKVVVADAGTQAIPAASVGDVVDVQIYLSNSVADSILSVTAATAVTDGSFVQVGTPLPVLIDDSTEITAWVVRMDTASAGAKTVTVTFTTDGTIATHNFDLTLTVA
ncbi:MAG: hypothetical protein ACYSR9_12105 [Planctomycetota bacterium]|jgi:hypothetical protein